MTTLRVEGRATAMHHLRQYVERGNNPRPLMARLAGIMMNAVEDNFEAQGRPRWVDLRPATKRARAAKGKWPGQILQVSQGGLASSIQQFSDSNRAVVGTNKKYGRIQQLGGTINRTGGSRVIHFSQINRGKMTFGIPGLGDRFAKPKKAHYAMRVTHGPYTITIPARPYLKLTDAGLRKMETATLDFIAGR